MVRDEKNLIGNCDDLIVSRLNRFGRQGWGRRAG